MPSTKDHTTIISTSQISLMMITWHIDNFTSRLGHETSSLFICAHMGWVTTCTHKQTLPQRPYKSGITNSIQGLGKTNYVVKRNRRYIIHNVKYHLTCTSFSTCSQWLANCLQPSFIRNGSRGRKQFNMFLCNWKTVLCKRETKAVFNPGLYSEIRWGFILFWFFSQTNC